MIRYEAPSAKCVGRARPGTMAIYAHVLNDNERFPDAYGLGIYNCRPVEATGSPSAHGRGRAGDVGFPIGSPQGSDLAETLVANHQRLGIQLVLWGDRAWRVGRGWFTPSKLTRDLHADHVHFEQTETFSDSVTDWLVAQTFGGPVPTPTSLLRQGDQGDPVARLQARLNRHHGATLPITGIFDTATLKELTLFQMAMELTADGIYGPKTATKLPDITNEEFITDLYHGKLGRIPAASSLEYWMKQLTERGETAAAAAFYAAADAEIAGKTPSSPPQPPPAPPTPQTLRSYDEALQAVTAALKQLYNK